MKLIARTWRGLYVQTSQGALYYVPTDGTTGYPVDYVEIEARSLRRRALELRQEGRRLRAKRYRRAARRLERLAAQAPAA
ncbi:MAG: hypothetical protein JNM56_29020 [Planctomycetia bacterium]|nr:hypothetical protein [Planctomycetia bacterium]